MSPFVLTGRLDGAQPLLLASPHSGRHLPADFLAGARVDVHALRRMEDAHVGDLLAPAAAAGIPLLEATHSRAVIDLNRGEDELDPVMFAGAVVRNPRLTDRVRRGYGLFPRVAAPGQPIHSGRIAPQVAARRIAALHVPWHGAISQGMQAARARHGFAVLLDLHSMPRLDGPAPAALVLGDLNGRSAAPALVDWLDRAFSDAGLKVGRNVPYAGGHTTERHGAPSAGMHCVQLEFDRSLYMDQQSLALHDGAAALSGILVRLIPALLAALPTLGLGGDHRLAAE